MDWALAPAKALRAYTEPGNNERFLPLVMLSKRELGVASENASKHPDHASFAVPQQGILPKQYAPE
jgi:hypothetical protein